MPKKQKKENLVHFDIDSLSKKAEKKVVLPAATLGQTLQLKREKKKLSLQDISAKLCIKEIYLQALEKGHYYAFPSRVYGIGFLRSYAKFLGLDSDALVAQFNQETADIKEEPMDMLVIEKHVQLPSRKTLWIVFSCICIILICWAVVSEILNPNSFMRVPVPEEVKTVSGEVDVDTTQDIPNVADEIEIIDSEAVNSTLKNEVLSKDKKEKSVASSTEKNLSLMPQVANQN